MAKQPRARSGSKGRLSYQPAPDDGPVSRSLEFVRILLPVWRDDPKRPQNSAEKSLNSSLCDFLDTRARNTCPMVRFKHEALQAVSQTVDIGIHGTEEVTHIGIHGYTIYEPFMVMEGKRLPAPSKDREREYVTGTNRTSGGPTGGIQRFKLGLHGAKVQTAVIIGYVEKHSVQHWFAKINEWISDLVGRTNSDSCIWSATDLLEELVCDDAQNTSTARSMHTRADECLTPLIRVHHLWVVMSSTKLLGSSFP